MEDIVKAAVWLLYKSLAISSRLYESQGLRNAAYLQMLGEHNQLAHSNGREIHMIELVPYAQYFDCSDLSDKVFALPGLHQRTTNLEVDSLPPPSLLEPDYGKSARDVIRDATRFAILESCTLDILHSPFNRIPAHMQFSLPSWVPTWFHKNEPGLDPLGLSYKFYSSRGLPPIVSNTELESEDADLLSLEGISVDVVNDSTVLMTGGVLDDTERLIKLLTQALAIASKARAVNDKNANSSAMAEALVGGKAPECEHAPCKEVPGAWIASLDCDAAICSAVAETMIGGLIRDPGLASKEDIRNGWAAFLDHLDRRQVPPWLRSIAETDGDAKRARYYYESLFNACRDRKFFTTRKGHIGLGPLGLQRGRWPVVLRPEH